VKAWRAAPRCWPRQGSKPGCSPPTPPTRSWRLCSFCSWPAWRKATGRARAFGVLVNVEDVLPLCDFHVPAIVRQGDLLLTASTGGTVPGLARALREHLAESFGPEWRDRLIDLSKERARFRSQGLSPGEVSQKVRDLVAEKGWL
jgi:precorrin-2 dehydrogenase/sirohydrochlorin ferrochelatase